MGGVVYRVYDICLELDYLIYYNIGCLFFNLGRINKALYYFKKSENLKKIDNSNLLNLSHCYLTLGNLDKGFSLSAVQTS